IEELRSRLVGRATDSQEAIDRRVAKASQELEYADRFDVRIVNDQLESALSEAVSVVSALGGRAR
ncbi:MAG: guanylate kinase, partial [Rikenellaceae bacterium]